MNTKLFLIWLIGIVCLSACQQSAHAPVGLEEFVKNPKNGLVKELKEGAFKYKLQYLPQQYLAVKDLGQNNLDEERLNLHSKKYEGHHYFLLHLEPNDKSKTLEQLLKATRGEEAYEDLMNQLRFHLSTDLSLSIGSTTLPCVLYHAEPPVFEDTGLRFSLVFSNPDYQKDEAFIEDMIFNFQDRNVSQKQISIAIEKEDLNRIPKIKL